MAANLINSAVATELKNVSFHSNPKERQCQRIFKLPHICTHLICWQILLKIFQARLQQYMNHALPDVQAEFRKGSQTRDQIAYIHWVIKKGREFQKNIYFCFIGYTEAFDCMDHNKLWKFIQDMGIPDHLTCLLRNLYADQKATDGTRYRTNDWFQTGKGVHQGCILASCLFNLYAEQIM